MHEKIVRLRVIKGDSLSRRATKFLDTEGVVYIDPEKQRVVVSDGIEVPVSDFLEGLVA